MQLVQRGVGKVIDTHPQGLGGGDRLRVQHHQGLGPVQAASDQPEDGVAALIQTDAGAQVAAGNQRVGYIGVGVMSGEAFGWQRRAGHHTRL